MRVRELGLYGRTLHHLKPVQVIDRVRRRFVRIRPTPAGTPSARTQTGPWIPAIAKPASILPGRRFHFLNRTETIADPVDWNAGHLPKLWLYNLHYHDGLLAGATAPDQKTQLIADWIAENPFGRGNGWEPYPLSLRIVNWIKWALAGGDLPDGTADSLFQQAHALSQQVEFHLLGNHLLANAKALIFAGLYFSGAQASAWYERGTRILNRQLVEQYLADGAHFELSTTYHATLTEDLLDILNILAAFGMDQPGPLRTKAAQALSWLSAMTRPDGLPPLFNDAAYGISPSLEELVSYARPLNLPIPSAPRTGMTDLPESGYFRFEGRDYVFWGDAGQIGPAYLPGHAHCDMLSFELYAHGAPLVVDTGTSTYEDGERRFTERSTRAHNTVQPGDLEQSEIWSAFRVGRRARITERTVSPTSAVAVHDGFKAHGVLHRRRFMFEDRYITLVDEIVGDWPGSATARFHLHPGISPKLTGAAVEAGPARFEFSDPAQIAILNYDYSPEFGRRLPGHVIEVHFTKKLQAKILI